MAVQTYPRIEHVVMDGGSTDGSVELLRRTPDVHWRSEPDRGQSHALNKAFAASHGEIIGWLNSDDAYFDRAVVEDVVGCFQAHPEVDVVYGHAARADQRGRVSHVLWVPPFSRWLLHWKCFLVQPAVFFRRAALGDRFLDERFQFAMDWELWLRLARSSTFHRLDRVLAIDRDQPGRKINTWQAVLETDRQRLATTYGIRLDPWYQRLGGFYELALRLGGVPANPAAHERPGVPRLPSTLPSRVWPVRSRTGDAGNRTDAARRRPEWLSDGTRVSTWPATAAWSAAASCARCRTPATATCIVRSHAELDLTDQAPTRAFFVERAAGGRHPGRGQGGRHPGELGAALRVHRREPGDRAQRHRRAAFRCGRAPPALPR